MKKFLYSTFQSLPLLLLYFILVSLDFKSWKMLVSKEQRLLISFSILLINALYLLYYAYYLSKQKTNASHTSKDTAQIIIFMIIGTLYTIIYLIVA